MTPFARIRHVLSLATVAVIAACAADPGCPATDPTCQRATIPDPSDGPDDTGWTTWATTGDPTGTSGTGSGTLADQDGDGHRIVDGDCDDLDALVFPGAKERCDGVDNDCSGFVDDGLATRLVQESDNTADGLPDSWVYTTYSAVGVLWFKEVDSDADGLIDSSEEYFYQYDGAGRLIALETDYDMDGTVDKVKRYHYDGAGRLVETDEDLGPDGVLDRIDTWFYDDAGVRYQWDMDSDGDGLVDTRYSYAYDASGLLISLRMDRYDDALVVVSSSVYAYEYNDQLLMWLVHVDLTADGVFDNTTDYLYDALGRTEYARTDLARDLDLDNTTFYAYDALTGDLSKIEMDNDADGDVDTRITRWEECSDA